MSIKIAKIFYRTQATDPVYGSQLMHNILCNNFQPTDWTTTPTHGVWYEFFKYSRFSRKIKVIRFEVTNNEQSGATLHHTIIDTFKNIQSAKAYVALIKE